MHFRCRPWRCRPPAPSCRPLIPKLDLIQSIKNQKINVQKMKSRPLRYDFKGIRCAMTDSKKYEKVLGFFNFSDQNLAFRLEKLDFLGFRSSFGRQLIT